MTSRKHSPEGRNINCQSVQQHFKGTLDFSQQCKQSWRQLRRSAFIFLCKRIPQRSLICLSLQLDPCTADVTMVDISAPIDFGRNWIFQTLPHQDIRRCRRVWPLCDHNHVVVLHLPKISTVQEGNAKSHFADCSVCLSTHSKGSKRVQQILLS